MQWLEKNSYKRSSPIRLWPEVKSIITLGVNYGPNYDPLRLLENPKIGNISVYAQGEDYHKIIKKNLKKLGTWIINKTDCQIKVFVDTATVMEKNISQESGIGWQGKHTNLVSREFGSWLFLGEIFTNIEFDYDSSGAADNPCTVIAGTQKFRNCTFSDSYILASELWIEKNNPSGIVFTILCDRGERYCSILDSY